MSDRATEIAAFLRDRRTADRGELLRHLIKQLPDAAAAEIQAAIDNRNGGRRVLVLSQSNPEWRQAGTRLPGGGRSKVQLGQNDKPVAPPTFDKSQQFQDMSGWVPEAAKAAPS